MPLTDTEEQTKTFAKAAEEPNSDLERTLHAIFQEAGILTAIAAYMTKINTTRGNYAPAEYQIEPNRKRIKEVPNNTELSKKIAAALVSAAYQSNHETQGIIQETATDCIFYMIRQIRPSIPYFLNAEQYAEQEKDVRFAKQEAQRVVNAAIGVINAATAVANSPKALRGSNPTLAAKTPLILEPFAWLVKIGLE